MSYQVKKCAWCKAENHPSKVACLKCGRPLSHATVESDLKPLGFPAISVETADNPSGEMPVNPPGPAPTAVSVVDINMPFASMVGFMVKWAFAAIPALLIILVVGTLALGVLRAIFHTH